MGKEISYIKRFFVLYVSGLSLLFAALLYMEISRELQTAIDYAEIEGEASYNKDLLYRRWAAMHGGVYVPVSDKTPPNPYLSHIPNRDIVMQDCTILTLINPAYMTRQVFEIAEEQYGVKGHITSLKPLSADNVPDNWERTALEHFENGAVEYSNTENIDGKEYLRFMHEMRVEDRCMKCHEHQGYKVGEIRGGISVSVPLDRYNMVATTSIRQHIIRYGLVYIVILVLSILAYKRYLVELNKSAVLQSELVKSESFLKVQNDEYAALNEEYKSQNEQLASAIDLSEKQGMNLAKMNDEYAAVIEELRQTNIELTSAKEKAEESERLKSAFLQNLSHEIRTPMNAIVGFSSLLGTKDLSVDRKDNFVNLIQNSSKQLLSIISDVLAISSIETQQEKLCKDQFTIDDVFGELENVYSHQALSKGVSFYSVNEIEQTVIEADKTKLIQALSNLVGNAIKFTSKGKIELGCKQEGDNLVFRVSDTGIGIDPKLFSVIFLPFRQGEEGTARAYGGTGLGLSIAKAYVEMMGGKIWAESKVKEGSIFKFTLPMITVEGPQKSVVESVHSVEQKIVVIAEDDEYNYLVLKELLSDLKLILLRARNGQECVDLCRANSNISLVLMDIKMPVLDGYQAALEIKKFNPSLPIFAQTAYALNNEVEHYKKAFDDYFTKPVTQQLLFEKVMKVLS